MAVTATDYKTVKEAAQAWGVTKRWVNMCIADGRVPGVVRMGSMWLIPCRTEKPGDLSGPARAPERSLSSDLEYAVTATHTSATADDPYAVLDTVSEERLRRIHEGALAYARGDFERTMLCFRQNEGDGAAQLCAASLTIAAAISTGDYPLYVEIESFLKNIIQTNGNSDVSAFAELALAGAYLGAMAPKMIPAWLKDGDFNALPSQARPDAAYKRAKYFQCVGDYKSMLAIAQTARVFCHVEHEISFPDTYLTLLCAAACFVLGDEGGAELYLLDAMKRNLPHGFITPFAELIPLFGGLIEKLLEREYPDRAGAVLGQWRRTFTNWITFHNRFTKDNITKILPLRDYEMALLAARGVPYAKIAEHFNISEGRLKNIMHEICEKLFISGRSRRKELAKFIL